MIFRKITLGLILAVLATTCLAQASLAVKNADGKVAGWLLDKINPDRVKLLTPTGFVLTMTSGGLVVNSADMRVDRLLYEDLECKGPAWAEVPPVWIFVRGEVLQMGSTGSGIFFTVPWNFFATQSEPLGLVAQITEDGNCTPAPQPFAPQVTLVDEINPADYGISENPVTSDWQVKPPHTYEVVQPNGLFCNGFESCPNP